MSLVLALLIPSYAVFGLTTYKMVRAAVRAMVPLPNHHSRRFLCVLAGLLWWVTLPAFGMVFLIDRTKEFREQEE